MHFWLEIVSMFISTSIRNVPTAVHRFLILAIFKNHSKQKAFLPCIKLVLNRWKNENCFFFWWGKGLYCCIGYSGTLGFFDVFLKTFQVWCFVEDWAYKNSTSMGISAHIKFQDLCPTGNTENESPVRVFIGGENASDSCFFYTTDWAC